jgi:hypothetical protein
MKKIHVHDIQKDKNGKRVMDDSGWYLCECGAKAFPNTGWIEPTPPTMKLDSQRIAEFREKFGIDDLCCGGDSCDRQNHREILNELESWLITTLAEARKETIERVEKEVKSIKELPYYAQPAQNRNGNDYCATCEQAWEECSCSARNTGHKKALETVRLALDQMKEEK